MFLFIHSIHSTPVQKVSVLADTSWKLCDSSLRFRKFASLPLDEKKFCQDCQILLLPGEHGAHSSHRSTAITAAQLRRPSVLLRPLDNKKSNAQYLFTDRSSHFLLDTLAGLGYRKVLCVGTPRWGTYKNICLNYGGLALLFPGIFWCMSYLALLFFWFPFHIYISNYPAKVNCKRKSF